ncbi:MAG: plasmid mobilization relaxosome protein MobC [Ruminococcus sp.]|nr:plasmid mobilization relaxosome protein MobC [Ruminococcus sp.]
MRKFKQVKRKEIVFDLDEWSKIEQQATELQLTTTEYIRRMALNQKVVRMNMPDIAPALNAMKSIANNLNQLAKKAHVTNNIYAKDFEEMGGQWKPLCLLLSQYLLEARSNAA